MSGEVAARSHARWNRMIAIAAGAITVIAIVLSFASGDLGLGWQWLRPAAELLLLAELVGLIILERHQLFEPVHAKVDDIKSSVSAVVERIETLTERVNASGHVEVYSNPGEFVHAAARVARAALTRDQNTPQLMRSALLSGVVFAQDDRDVAPEIQEAIDAMASFTRWETGRSEPRARFWSQRVVWTVASVEALKITIDFFRRIYFDRRPLNLDLKIATRNRLEPLLSPGIITDLDAALDYGNREGDQRWGVMFHGRQYVELFARWFDDVWADIPDSYLVYSRSGLNEKAIDAIKRELETAVLSPSLRTA